MDSQTLTQDRFAKQAERTAKDFGWGDTAGARGISATYLEEATALVVQSKKYLKPREHGVEVSELDPRLLALVGLTTGISGVAQGTPLARLPGMLGDALEAECYAAGLSGWDEKRAADLMNRVVKSHRNIKYRKTALRSLAQKAKFPWTKWTSKEKALAGRWLLEVMLETSVFMLDAEGQLTITQDALDVSDRVVRDLLERHPMLLPAQEPPAEWKGYESTLHGYRISLVRSRDQVVQRTVKAAIRDGRMAASLRALNGAQGVAYTINQPIMEMVRWCYEQGINVPGMPPRDDLPLPEYTAEMEADENRMRAHRKARRDLRVLNRSYLGERLMYEQDMATAEHLASGPFWTPMNFDYRGRVYGIPRFNFQRQDYVRGMFNFEEGQHLTADGLYWLKVHIANCGDFGKISKQPFDARVKWLNDNLETILEYTDDPKQYLGWTEADSPFCFLAGCLALRDHYESRPVHTPVSFDGTCSGLQHLGAMTRDEQTCKLVNLTDTDKPNDVYQVVAELAKQRMTADLADPDTCQLASMCLDAGVDRSLVKRNVMCFSYSSKSFGMSEQHMEDTMIPLNYQVLAGKLDAHPYGEDGGLKASRYLAKITYGAIKDTVHRPAEAMEFLQSIARTMSHEGKPCLWHTPLGFPVVMRYSNFTTTRVTLTLHDRGVQITLKPHLAAEAPGIDKRRAASAIAPSFVHSLDACHLMSTVLAANDAGINSVALVHDSFGCLPNQASEYRTLIQSTFHDLYENNDVLFDILRESAGQLDSNWHRLPNMPDKGSYEMNVVLEASYAFA